MSLKSYYERQAATSRRLAEQAVTQAVAQRLLSAANDYEQRARSCEIRLVGAEGAYRGADLPDERTQQP